MSRSHKQARNIGMELAMARNGRSGSASRESIHVRAPFEKAKMFEWFPNRSAVLPLCWLKPYRAAFSFE